MKKKKIVFIVTLLLITIFTLRAQDTVFVKEARVPILIERKDNILFYIKIDAKKSQQLDAVSLSLGKELPLSRINRLNSIIRELRPYK